MVPGAGGASEKLLAAYGRRELGEVSRPAIRYAEDGFPVAPRVAFDGARAAWKLRDAGADGLRVHGTAPPGGRLCGSWNWPQRSAPSPPAGP
jgi:gamma-glutamyltranspeptidase/glutathione hydrolase